MITTISMASMNEHYKQTGDGPRQQSLRQAQRGQRGG